jgi:hypothetical protein
MCLPPWGGRKVDLELIEWRSTDLHSINSTSTLFSGSIPPNCPSLSSPPPQTVTLVDCCFGGWRSTCTHSACCRPPIAISSSSSHRRCPIAVVQLLSSNCHGCLHRHRRRRRWRWHHRRCRRRRHRCCRCRLRHRHHCRHRRRTLSLSHRRHQIAVVQSPSSNHRRSPHEHRCHWWQQRHHCHRRRCHHRRLCHRHRRRHRWHTPSLSHHRRPIAVVLSPSSNAAVVVIDIVAIDGGGRNIAIVITIAVAVAFAVAVAVSTIAVVAVIVGVTSLMLLHHHRRRRAPWRPIGGAGPNHATDTLPMACGWRPYPWIGRAGAGGIDTRTLPSCCRPVGNIMLFERWKLEVMYPTIDGTYSYGKLRERKMRNCAGTFLS